MSLLDIHTCYHACLFCSFFLFRLIWGFVCSVYEVELLQETLILDIGLNWYNTNTPSIIFRVICFQINVKTFQVGGTLVNILQVKQFEC